MILELSDGIRVRMLRSAIHDHYTLAQSSSPTTSSSALKTVVSNDTNAVSASPKAPKHKAVTKKITPVASEAAPSEPVQREDV
jgi:hypothetical protein